MVAIDFPSNPTTGQQFTAAGITWIWDGSKWTTSGSGGPYLPFSGGTLTGPLILAADPTVPLGASTKQYVDNEKYGDNRIINGDMWVGQRGLSGGSAAAGYALDRWAQNSNPASLVNWAQGSGTGAPLGYGFEYWIGFQSITSHVIAAADYAQVYQPIEADMVYDLAWGTVSAQPITLSFVVYSSLVGIFSGCITNSGATRSYPFTYSIPTANTWTKISVTIPGDTTGTWLSSGNGAGLVVHFSLGSGSTYSGPAGTWASANYVGATGSVAIIATNNAIWNITGVKLEVGSIATPFNRQSLTKSMADCQRYYSIVPLHGLITAQAAGWYIIAPGVLPVQMRAIPTLSYTPSSSNLNVGTVSFDGITQANFRAYSASIAAGATQIEGPVFCSAEL
jgi:hypothetical protein